MTEEPINMIEECTNHYYVEDVSDKETEIYFKIPREFKYLWIVKLNELVTTENEINKYKEW